LCGGRPFRGAAAPVGFSGDVVKEAVGGQEGRQTNNTIVAWALPPILVGARSPPAFCRRVRRAREEFSARFTHAAHVRFGRSRFDGPYSSLARRSGHWNISFPPLFSRFPPPPQHSPLSYSCRPKRQQVSHLPPHSDPATCGIL